MSINFDLTPMSTDLGSMCHPENIEKSLRPEPSQELQSASRFHCERNRKLCFAAEKMQAMQHNKQRKFNFFSFQSQTISLDSFRSPLSLFLSLGSASRLVLNNNQFAQYFTHMKPSYCYSKKLKS